MIKNRMVGDFMKKILKILIVSIIALSCALSMVGCDDPSNKNTEPGLHYKKINGVYTIYKYNAEEGVEVLDIDAVISDENVVDIKIKKGAFAGNNSLKSIIVPERVTEIEEGAFKDMKVLESITLPFVGKNANADAYLGESKDAVDKSVDKARTIAHLFGETEYDAGLAITVNYNSVSSSTVYVPRTFNSVTVKTSSEYTIPMYAFSGAANLLEVKIEGGVIGIGESAFYNCKELRTLTITAPLTTVYKNALVGTKVARTALDGISTLTLTDELKNDIFGELNN